MLMLDLCSGLGGASAAMRDREWTVITIDNNPDFSPGILADVRQWSWDGQIPDLIWASPPCVEFSRESMPWSRTGTKPDLSIVKACYRIIQESKPQYWIIENVRGAQQWLKPILGPTKTNYGAFYLWGFFPDLGDFSLDYKKKESYSSVQRAKRAMIPYQLSFAVALAIERSKMLI